MRPSWRWVPRSRKKNTASSTVPWPSLSPVPARIPPPSAPQPNWTVTSGSSTARKSTAPPASAATRWWSGRHWINPWARRRSNPLLSPTITRASSWCGWKTRWACGCPIPRRCLSITAAFPRTIFSVLRRSVTPRKPARRHSVGSCRPLITPGRKWLPWPWVWPVLRWKLPEKYLKKKGLALISRNNLITLRPGSWNFIAWKPTWKRPG